MDSPIVRDYRTYLRIERRMSPNTVSSYCHDVRDFLSIVGKEPSGITSEDISGQSHVGRALEAQQRKAPEFPAQFLFLVRGRRPGEGESLRQG